MLLTNIHHAARSLLRAPSFTLLVMATLGLGLGASTAIFSALYRLQFAPLPFETADRIVNLARTQRDEGFFLSPQPAVVRAWQEHATTLEHVAIIVEDKVTLTEVGEPAELTGARVSPQLAEMLRVPPLLGRMLTDEDAAADAPVVVLSEALWRERFGADERIPGRTIALAGRPMTVIGVMPARFARIADPLPRHDLWLPYVFGEAHFPRALGLMRTDASVEQVSAELARIADEIDRETGLSQFDYAALPLTEMLSSSSRRILPLLLGAVALVLLIACANVAGLMIVRLNARRREIAIRATLGAGARRILGTIAAEQLLLAIGASVAGLLLATWTMEVIARFQPRSMPLLDTLALDPAVLAFSAILLFASIFLSGVAPTWVALRRDPADAMRAGGERVASGNRLRSALVTGQIALSVVLLVGAVLLIRSYAAQFSRNLGFEPDRALAVELALPDERYTPEQKEAFFTDLLAGVASVPGLSEAAVGGGVPPEMGLTFLQLSVDESDVSTSGIHYVTGTWVTPGFLHVLGATFVEGRDFSAERSDSNAVIVSRSFAAKFWPGERAAGRRIRMTANPAEPWKEIVGVIEDVRLAHGQPDGLQIFSPMQWIGPQTLLVRTDAENAGALMPHIRQAVKRLDPHLPIREAATLERRIAESLSRERFVMLLLGVFAALALMLTVVGLYGLIAYTVQQRLREIGIRLALGATARAVRELFVARGMRLVAVGLLLGIIGAAAAVELLRALVYGVDVYDGISFAAAVLLIAPAALLASWLPARRAARVDPIVTLRSD